MRNATLRTRPAQRALENGVPFPPDTATLRREGRALGRFVLGHDVEPIFVDRYVDAHQHLPLTAAPDDDAIVAFAIAHARLLPCIEAAAALTRPHGTLHRKAILMLAILEASPDYAVEFLPRATSWAQLARIVVRAGVGTVVRLAIGIPLLMLQRAHR